MTEIMFLYRRTVVEFVADNGFERIDLQDKVMAEMNTLREDGLEHPLKLMMHVFNWNGQDFIITPGDANGQRVLFVDLCEYADGPEISEGPFKGKRLSMPVPVGSKDEVMERYPELESKKVTKH